MNDVAPTPSIPIAALEALRAANFNWVRSLGSIWADADSISTGPNDAVLESVMAEFLAETRDEDSQPNGRALVGQSGIGKTHLLADLRQKVWQSGGWFVLLDVLGLTDFWRGAALSFLTSLLQEMPDGRRQFQAVLAGVARRFNVEKQVEDAFNTPNIEAPKIVNLLVKGLAKANLAKTLEHQDVFRALCLLRSTDLDTISFAHGWLQGYDADENVRKRLGFQGAPPPPVKLVAGMSWIMSLAGPTLVAVDQIDGVVNPANLAIQSNDDLGSQHDLASVLAAGLLDLHNVRQRGQTIITCLFDSWKVLEERGLVPFRQRFNDPLALQGMKGPLAIKELIEKRLRPAYASALFSPPSPTWPFSEAAIAGAASVAMTPRTVLMRCEAFRQRCFGKREVDLCTTLLNEPICASPTTISAGGHDSDLASLTQSAQIDDLIAAGDDGELGRVLREVFDLYARQIEPDEARDIESKGDRAQRNPPLHGRLTFTYHDQNDREVHFCFRAIEHTNAISFQARLRAALTASGISNRIPGRHLLVVRRASVPSGAKTQRLFAAFKSAGGVLINPSDDDLRVFVALRRMRDGAEQSGKQTEFESWLRAKQPLLDTAFFKQAGLAPPPLDATAGSPPPSASAPSTNSKPAHSAPAYAQSKGNAASAPAATSRPHPAPPHVAPSEKPATKAPAPAQPAPAPVGTIPIGRRIGVGDEPVTLPLKVLPRHTAIIAGSGSGKTVLLRRLVEEAALAGIPAIVIDPNNDLSRLGDMWPERPTVFTSEDDAKAKQYRENVEVVIWTPGVHAGRPIFLPTMPDFSGLGSDRDERDQAVEMAAETLIPLAGAKKAVAQGVLTETLRYFASQGGGDLNQFTALLTELPDDVSQIGNAAKLAAGMADELRAAVATKPLLRAEGPVLDPRVLFFGSDPKRTRVSVINLSGLGSDAGREDFVNRLQMTLFGWIKKNPSPSGLLYVVDEAQTFLPSGKGTLSLNSGIKLFAQARKYGLGVIVATQAPKGIHNQIISNCTTQFFGKQSSPATIDAAQEMIAASQGRADDIGKLKAGEFYFATEGLKPVKVRTPICLSYHPANPPTPQEVLARAKQPV